MKVCFSGQVRVPFSVEGDKEKHLFLMPVRKLRIAKRI